MLKIYFLGDSITAGAGASKPENNFVNLVKVRAHCDVVNYGVSGTRIARQKEKSLSPQHNRDFNLRAREMEKNANFVFVFGGTNDFGHGMAPFGKISDNTVYTFNGALNVLIKYLIRTYGKDKICFILPTPRGNQNSIYGDGFDWCCRKRGPLKKYIDYIVSACKRYGVDYLDLRNLFPVPYLYNSPTKYTVDGLHPNDLGHEIIAEEIIKYLTKKFGQKALR